MNRIFEFTPATEESVVPRILLLVHQAVDENFPTAEHGGRQFSKTVFSDEAVEKTAGDHNAPEDGLPPGPLMPPLPPGLPGPLGIVVPSLGSGVREEKTPDHSVPPPPLLGAARHSLPRVTPRPHSAEKDPKVASPLPQPAPTEGLSLADAAHAAKDHANAPVLSEQGMALPEQTRKKVTHRGQREADWTTRITLALLLAGLILLGYVVLA